jgi:hypothetical protein
MTRGAMDNVPDRRQTSPARLDAANRAHSTSQCQVLTFKLRNYRTCILPARSRPSGVGQAIGHALAVADRAMGMPALRHKRTLADLAVLSIATVTSRHGFLSGAIRRKVIFLHSGNIALMTKGPAGFRRQGQSSTRYMGRIKQRCLRKSHNPRKRINRSASCHLVRDTLFLCGSIRDCRGMLFP